MNHWFVAITFVLLALSGLALFHPSMFWLTNLFGGGPWTRILHPFIGLVMFAAVRRAGARFWHHNVLADNDRQWLRQWRDVINNREDMLPEVGPLQRRAEGAVLGDGCMHGRAAADGHRDLAAVLRARLPDHRDPHRRHCCMRWRPSC